MLRTADEGRKDGEFRRYLEKPEQWCKFDPDLYKSLQRLLKPGIKRNVKLAEEWDILPGATYFWESLEDELPRRESYFKEAWQELAACPLLFFDPDNGIEVESVRRGNKRSSKYIYWKEIKEAYVRHSLVIYQHFPREKRDAFIQRMAKQLANCLNAPLVDSFRTPHVVFFLVSRPEHVSRFKGAHDNIKRRWHEQIKPLNHVDFSSTKNRVSLSFRAQRGICSSETNQSRDREGAVKEAF